MELDRIYWEEPMSENYEEVKVKDKVYIQGQFYLMNVK